LNALPFSRYALHLDALGCPHRTNDPALVLLTLQRIADVAGMHVMGSTVHRVHGEGCKDGWSGIAIIKESHIAVHTWPSCGGVMFDLVSCRPFEASAVRNTIIDAFGLTQILHDSA